jgi:hypothetical protein
VTGTVAAAVTGTVAAAVTGTVAAAVTGTVAAAVTGTVAAAVTGTVAAAVTGTVAAAVTGTVAAAVMGPRHRPISQHAWRSGGRQVTGGSGTRYSEPCLIGASERRGWSGWRTRPQANEDGGSDGGGGDPFGASASGDRLAMQTTPVPRADLNVAGTTVGFEQRGAPLSMSDRTSAGQAAAAARLRQAGGGGGGGGGGVRNYAVPG